MQKILVTGANGFLGRNLLNTLARNTGLKVYGLVKSKKKIKRIKNIKYIQGDITNFKKLKKSIKINFDIIINFAGNINHKNKKQTFDAHYKGLKNLLKVINYEPNKLFIQIGSSLEYGKKKYPNFEEDDCVPISHYGKSKNLATKFVQKKLKNFLILRLYQVYGPLQKKDRIIPITIDSCLKDNSFACSDALQKKDFMYVDDFVKLIVKILKKRNFSSGIYNVGSGKSIKIRTVINKIRRIIKKGKPLFGKIEMRKEEVLNSFPCISKIKKTFGWKPTTNLQKGLLKTIKSYEN